MADSNPFEELGSFGATEAESAEAAQAVEAAQNIEIGGSQYTVSEMADMLDQLESELRKQGKLQNAPEMTVEQIEGLGREFEPIADILDEIETIIPEEQNKFYRTFSLADPALAITIADSISTLRDVDIRPQAQPQSQGPQQAGKPPAPAQGGHQRAGRQQNQGREGGEENEDNGDGDESNEKIKKLELKKLTIRTESDPILSSILENPQSLATIAPLWSLLKPGIIEKIRQGSREELVTSREELLGTVTSQEDPNQETSKTEILQIIDKRLAQLASNMEDISRKSPKEKDFHLSEPEKNALIGDKIEFLQRLVQYIESHGLYPNMSDTDFQKIKQLTEQMQAITTRNGYYEVDAKASALMAVLDLGQNYLEYKAGSA